jgi:hypothetical protein
MGYKWREGTDLGSESEKIVEEEEDEEEGPGEI